MHEYNLRINNKPFNIQVIKFSATDAELQVNGINYSVAFDEPPASLPAGEIVASVLSEITIPDVKPFAKPTESPQSSVSANLNPVSPQEGMNAILAPIPGSITEIKVKPHESINSGQLLIKMEAMKMENEICSEVDGIVESVEVSAGDSVQQGQCLLRIK